MSTQYLSAQQSRFDNLLHGIEDLKTRAASEGRDLSEVEMAHVRSAAADMEPLAVSIKALHDQEESAAKVRALSMGAHDVATKTRAVGPIGLDGGQVLRAIDAMQRNAVWSSREDQMHVRAVQTLALVGGSIAGGYPMAPAPRRLAAVAGIPTLNTDMRGASGPQWPVTSAGLAATAESATKPEAPNSAALAIVPAVYARWTDFTLQAALSQAGYLEMESAFHARLIARDEDKAIIAAASVGATALAATAATLPAVIRTAVATVEAKSSLSATVVVVNPSDFAAATAYVPNNAVDFGNQTGAVSGAKIYASEDIAAGSVLVFAPAGLIEVIADPFNSKTVFSAPKTNTWTMVSEEVVGFGVVQLGSAALITVA